MDTLWEFLAIAAHEESVSVAKRIPVVSAHLKDWKRMCDFGYLALSGNVPIGAAWARQFQLDENPALFVNESTPELCVAVHSRFRGMGIGAHLLERLHSEARVREVDLCLNVNDDNPARRLYLQLSYYQIPGMEKPNRFGGTSIAMLRRLKARK